MGGIMSLEDAETIDELVDLPGLKFKEIGPLTQTSDQRAVKVYKNWAEAIKEGDWKLAERHQLRSRKQKYLSINGLDKSELDRMKAELDRFTDYRVKEEVFVNFREGYLTYNI